MALLVVAHVFLALAIHALPALATLHALLCWGAAMVFAASTRHIARVSYALGYLTGCEVLWRMCKASIFWEFGKYAFASVVIVALFRIRVRRNRALALAYFLLLLPSVMLTFATLDLERARQEISFNLSGPLAISLSVLFFSNIRLTASQTAAAFAAVVIPVAGIASLTLASTTAHDHLEFVNAANAATSGGFGPNQVSAMLGLGMMFVLLILIEHRLPWRLRLISFAGAALLGAQSALTFARGGLATSLSGTLAAVLFIARGNRRGRVAILVLGLLGLGLTKYVIEPRLEAFTNGEISQRYSSTKTSGRDLFVASELELFKESPILGVGPGVGEQVRKERNMFIGASHTEYSRMLAEHGILGAASLLCLLALGWKAFRQARNPVTRGLSTALVVWTFLFLGVYGTRIVAPAFAFGLAFVLRPVPPARRVAPAGPTLTPAPQTGAT